MGRPPRGLFISFEGVDGAGKTTQVGMLASALEADGRDVVVTHEPGGTALGERVRDVLLDARTGRLAPVTEALLFAASRAELVAEVIEPAIERGAIVLSDRFVDSSIVYQGLGRGLGVEQVEELNRWATAGRTPDLVVLLELDAGTAHERLGPTPDRMEALDASFHATVAKGFHERALTEPERYAVVDASGSPDEVAARILDVVRGRVLA